MKKLANMKDQQLAVSVELRAGKERMLTAHSSFAYD
jgi:hypothetical protein